MAEPVQTDREQRRLIRMAETISKALPYMRRHNDATFVVKYGGHAMTDPKLSRRAMLGFVPIPPFNAT